ncbi:unnamed protein product [Dibothriocephalus latus]|uniref:Uncharacterized protein n=1 Tax=Dibothriocephalus latus TaxID=60516 RepID=A0A3P7NW97_DIBLA|nr:unnamed protein product [Dibothriocephalus latus]
MAEFSKRVAEYPVVNDSLKVASNAYTWVSSGEHFKSIFQLSEQAANVLKEKAKSLASTGAVSQLDDIACRQILDRIESVVPHVKKPTEDLLGPIADRALTAAESYLEYFIPSVKDTKPDDSQPLSRYDRLMRLQSALAGSEKVQAAQATIASVYQKMQDSLNTISPSHLAKTTDSVSQYAVEQMRAILDGLHSTLTSLNERRESWMHSLISEQPAAAKEAVEMQELHPATEVGPLSATPNHLASLHCHRT